MNNKTKNDNKSGAGKALDTAEGSVLNDIRELIFYADPIDVILLRAECRGINKQTVRYALNLMIEFEWAYLRGKTYFFNNFRWAKDVDEKEWKGFLSPNAEHERG